LLSYSFISIVFFLRILFSFQEGFSFLLEGLAGMFVLGVFSLALFYMGQWGGGDVKLFIGLGGLLGLRLTLFNPIIIFLACIAVAGAVYGLFFILTLSFIHFKRFKIEFSRNVKKNMKWLIFFILLTIVAVVLLFFFKDPLAVSSLAIIVIFPVLLLLFLASKSLESICFRKSVPVDELTEGDWLVKEIKADDKIVFKAKKEGLYKKDIEKLKELKKQGLIDKVEVKTGMPFVPVFFFAFILYLVIQYSGVLNFLG